MSSQPSNIHDPIFGQREKYLQALRKGDVDQIVALVARDAVWMPPNDTSLYGSDEVRAWFEEYFQYFRIAAISETERDVNITGDWAVERISYMIAISPATGKTRIRDDGRMLTIWKRQDGSWKIWQCIWNSIKPVGAGTNRYMARLMQKKTRSKN